MLLAQLAVQDLDFMFISSSFFSPELKVVIVNADLPHGENYFVKCFILFIDAFQLICANSCDNCAFVRNAISSFAPFIASATVCN